MVLERDGVRITLVNDIQIAAYKKSGYRELAGAENGGEPKAAKPVGKTKKQIKKED